ncbi:hypothetical protein BD777DRAFT_130931 [Yarrowia lipolytica]|nr:hypothetical protein BKA90DRAFT_138044 [Yarrowia lipolytica]RMI94871.1 hypothetical protein BD777DRAFT_130931 [Yarrowia lipolytica]
MPRYSILLAVQLLIFLQLQSRMTGIYGFSVIRSLPSTVTPRFTCIVATNRLDRLNRLNGPLFFASCLKIQLEFEIQKYHFSKTATIVK